MEELLLSIWNCLVFVLPAYMANASPTILGKGKRLNMPIDCGKYWKGRKELGRILGDGKTVRGFIGGVTAGTVTGMLLILIFDSLSINIGYLSLIPDSITYQLLDPLDIDVLWANKTVFGGIIGFIQGTGALIGDLIGSFIKRRRGLKRGESYMFMDQLGFIVVALILIYPLIPWPIGWLVFLIPATFALHVIFNLLGYLIGIQDVPL